MKRIALFFAILLAFAYISATSQDENPCHSDEEQITDPRGGYRCVPRKQFEEYPAEDCVKDFKVDGSTRLVIPLNYDGSQNLYAARLEHFEFKLVCGVKK